MTITEPARHRLYEKLEGVLGMDDAETLMAHLPPVGWADVATRSDLDQLHDRIQVDLAGIRIEMIQLRADLRSEMDHFRTDLRAEMDHFRTDLRAEMDRFRTDIRAERSEFRDELHRDRIAAQRQLLFVLVVAALGLIGTIANAL